MKLEKTFLQSLVSVIVTLALWATASLLGLELTFHWSGPPAGLTGVAPAALCAFIGIGIFAKSIKAESLSFLLFVLVWAADYTVLLTRGAYGFMDYSEVTQLKQIQLGALLYGFAIGGALLVFLLGTFPEGGRFFECLRNLFSWDWFALILGTFVGAITWGHFRDWWLLLLGMPNSVRVSACAGLGVWVIIGVVVVQDRWTTGRLAGRISLPTT